MVKESEPEYKSDALLRLVILQRPAIANMIRAYLVSVGMRLVSALVWFPGTRPSAQKDLQAGQLYSLRLRLLGGLDDRSPHSPTICVPCP